MIDSEIRRILDNLLDRESDTLSVPTSDDWFQLENKFKCTFPSEFKTFIELMSEYSFPGDILNVSDVGTNGNDTIQFTYDYEMKNGLWPKTLIPFFNVGNGDYFCIDSTECPTTGVYYVSHDDNSLIKDADSFAEWLKKLPEFLV